MELIAWPKYSRWKVDVCYLNSGNIHEYLEKPLILNLWDKYFFGQPWTKYIHWQLSCLDGEVPDYWCGHSSYHPIQYRYPWGEHRRTGVSTQPTPFLWNWLFALDEACALCFKIGCIGLKKHLCCLASVRSRQDKCELLVCRLFLHTYIL